MRGTFETLKELESERAKGRWEGGERTIRELRRSADRCGGVVWCCGCDVSILDGVLVSVMRS
jgi:hypothetical protein